MADENMNTIHITEKQKVQEITDKLLLYFAISVSDKYSFSKSVVKIRMSNPFA